MTALWRISIFRDLEGLGGERESARWHIAGTGKRIVYLSEHPALALVEVLANLRGDPTLFARQYQLMKIAVRDGVSTGVLPVEKLSGSWQENLEETRFLGDSWLAGRSSALLGVPSVPSPESVNYLFNPQHPDASGLSIEWYRWIEYDQRLFHIHKTQPLTS